MEVEEDAAMVFMVAWLVPACKQGCHQAVFPRCSE